MTRALVLGVLALTQFSAGGPGPALAQTTSVLHVKVVLSDGGGEPTPVSRHALLVSDNPASAPPRRIVTAPDGTVSVTLRPGLYTVESDRPVTFNGRAYQWTQMIEIVAGRDATLELTSGNAEVVPVASPSPTAAAPVADDPSFLLSRWQDSVVALWAPTSRASGFLADARGLVVTSRRAIGDATAVEVQLTTSVKVMGRLLAADSARDAAVLWIDPKVVASLRPLPLACAPPAGTPVAEGDEVFVIGAPLRGDRTLVSGTVGPLVPRAIPADIRLGPGTTGGPAFTAAGDLIGVASVADEQDQQGRWDGRIVRSVDVCEVLTTAEKKMSGTPAPGAVLLPVEPPRPAPRDANEDAARRQASLPSPYQASSSDFDVALITPILLHAAQRRQDSGDERTTSASLTDAAQERMRLLTDFGGWSEYVAEMHPVLLVRVTPRLVEGFWTKVARGAAYTQGMALPPMKRFKSGFSRMRAFCGSAEVTPIHPFRIERRVSEKDVLYEGLYVFDPGALGPHCGTVRLELFSEKAPQKADTATVEPAVLRRIWEDFAPYRTPIA